MPAKIPGMSEALQSFLSQNKRSEKSTNNQQAVSTVSELKQDFHGAHFDIGDAIRENFNRTRVRS